MVDQFPRRQTLNTEAADLSWRSEDQSLVDQNLGKILESASYRLAHADGALLESEEMRGVRMLLEITKPQQILDAEGISSTIIIFGGVNIIERGDAEERLARAESALAAAPNSRALQRQMRRSANSSGADILRRGCPCRALIKICHGNQNAPSCE